MSASSTNGDISRTVIQSVFGHLATLDHSPVWFAQRGAAVSLPWLASLDFVPVRNHCIGLANTMLAGLDRPTSDSAIIALDLPVDSACALAETGAAVSTRAGCMRLSFHLYNTMDDVEMALRALTVNR